MTGMIVGPRAAAQLREDHAKLKHFQAGVNGRRNRVRGQRTRRVILDEDLYAGTLDNPSTAQATFLIRTEAGLVESADPDDVVTLVNYCQGVSIPSGTYAKVEWIDGQWEPYFADCPLDASSGV